MSIGTLLTYGLLRPKNKQNTILIPGYKMYSVGDRFPAAVKAGPLDFIVCERIDVTSEAQLSGFDLFEGCAGNTPNCLYHRINEGPDWLYLYNRPVAGLEQIEHGDWLRYLEEKEVEHACRCCT